MKRRLPLLFLLGLLLCSCGGGSSSSSQSKVLGVGILQPVEHNALTEARHGFIEALNDAAIKKGYRVIFDYKNANGNSADLNTYAKTLVSSCNLSLGIGTGAAQALVNQSYNLGLTKPVLFTAVTDPVGAKLVESWEHPESYVTGTSDVNPVEDQINLICECLPKANKLGIIYTQSEVNSKVQAEQAKAQGELKGFTVVTKTCTGSSDIAATVMDLAGQVDALYVPTDNNIAAHMDVVKANSGNALVVVGEEGQLKNGGHITLSVNYKELGKRTAEMAANILFDDKKISECPVTKMSLSECSYVYSSANCKTSGIELPKSVTDKCKDIDAE